MTLGVTIKMNAAHNSVTVDGKTFDRSQMTKPAINKLRRLLKAAYEVDKEK